MAINTRTQPFYGSLVFVRDNPGEPVPEETSTHSHLSWSSVIPYLLPPSITIDGILPVQFTSFSTISVQVFFDLPLDLAPSTSYSIHFFTQSLSSLCSICPYHRNLFCCSTEIMSSNPNLSLNPLSCSLMPQIHLTILISAHWSATSLSFLTGRVQKNPGFIKKAQPSGFFWVLSGFIGFYWVFWISRKNT